jgi:hypothetical protein
MANWLANHQNVLYPRSYLPEVTLLIVYTPLREVYILVQS